MRRTRQVDHRKDEPDGQRHQRQRLQTRSPTNDGIRHGLIPARAHARAAIATYRYAVFQTSASLPNHQADDPDQHRADARSRSTRPSRKYCKHGGQNQYRHPSQVADAGEEMENQRNGPAEQQQQADRRPHEPLGVVESLRPKWQRQPATTSAAVSRQLIAMPVTRCRIDNAMLSGQR